MTEMLDKDIIDRVNDGDAEAFEELVRRYEKRCSTSPCVWWATGTMPPI